MEDANLQRPLVAIVAILRKNAFEFDRPSPIADRRKPTAAKLGKQKIELLLRNVAEGSAIRFQARWPSLSRQDVDDFVDTIEH
jgi:hypothetical protein